MSKLKILITGSVMGQYSKLFKRVKDVNMKAGPFDLVLCVGNFFGDENATSDYDELINGSIELPSVPTYILSKAPRQLLKFHPNIESFDQGCELIDGITLLGRAGILTTSLGLRIAYLNGSYVGKNSGQDDPNLERFTQKEFDSLVMSHQSSSAVIDILLTTQWPKHLFNYVNSSELGDQILSQVNDSSSLMISQLCHLLRPRYHFVGSSVDLFYERVPYRNHEVINERVRQVTRFISMARIDSSNKKSKWIYAFNLIPSQHLSTQELTTQPDQITENPFRLALQEKKEHDSVEQNQTNQYFFNTSHKNSSNQSFDDDSYHNKRKFNNQNERRPPKQMKIDLEKCWFCLASPNVDKTLIVSIGDYSYLALAKGGLTDDHMMILPIEHIRSTVEIDKDELKEEIDRFKLALGKFFQTRSMVPVFFERNFKSAHFQIQVIGLPESKASALKETVDEVFKSIEHHELSLDTNLDEVIPANIPYFYFECPENFKFFVRINPKREFFPIQIGRQLLAHPSLLDCADRIDWKRCTMDSEQAKNLTTSIRSSFKPFDFTL